MLGNQLNSIAEIAPELTPHSRPTRITFQIRNRATHPGSDKLLEEANQETIRIFKFTPLLQAPTVNRPVSNQF